MESGFFRFVLEPSKESFLEARRKVVEHDEYDPYSFILDDIKDLLDEKEYAKVLEIDDINLLLSPRAHSYKRYAFEGLEMHREAEIAVTVLRKILECILLTGDGSKEYPYIVTKVQDEYDLLSFIGEESKLQSLIIEETCTYDKVETKSGKTIFFDITDCHSMTHKIDEDTYLDRIFGEEESENEESTHKDESSDNTKKKSRWKFWGK